MSLFSFMHCQSWLFPVGDFPKVEPQGRQSWYCLVCFWYSWWQPKSPFFRQKDKYISLRERQRPYLKVALVIIAWDLEGLSI